MLKILLENDLLLQYLGEEGKTEYDQLKLDANAWTAPVILEREIEVWDYAESVIDDDDEKEDDVDSIISGASSLMTDDGEDDMLIWGPPLPENHLIIPYRKHNDLITIANDSGTLKYFFYRFNTLSSQHIFEQS